ncbi:hypothetical protein JWH17_03875 [Desulfobulbus marinus]|nr:hypothetical protein [Desulfogranum marinum]
MSILDHESVFSAMLQNGPFATVKSSPLAEHMFSKASKSWVAALNNDQLMKTKYRLVRNQIFDLLGINSLDETLHLIHIPTRRQEAISRSHSLLANMFGISGSPHDVTRHLNDYARTADDVIQTLRSKVLAPYSSHLETTNEITSTNEPVTLLLCLFDDRFHEKARFEAKRKLALMGLAGSIDHRERETCIADKFSEFINFLNMFVWSSNLKIGEMEPAYLYSKHNPDDFQCAEVETLTPEAAQRLSPQKGTKLTLIKRRRFNDRGTEIPIYVTIRKKAPAAKVIKLLRKNEKNPATAVDDELGLMAVLNSVNDVNRFVRHLTRCAAKAGSFMTLEDISDTLTGGRYNGNATGSSTKTAMLKFFARIGGMRVEFIIHTNRSYLNYMYQRDVAHDEYEVKRLFDTGVAEFLFPRDFYHLNLTSIRDRQLARFRKLIEES